MAAVVVVFGLPGSGKSTVAKRLAKRLDAAWISSDAVRTELGLRGDYSKESIAAVYREMMERGAGHLGAGRNVVLDGSFSNRRFRREAREFASTSGSGLAFIHMMADEQTTLERVRRKRRHTEAGPSVYRLLQKHFDPLDEPHLTLDSSSTGVGRLLARALRYLDKEMSGVEAAR